MNNIKLALFGSMFLATSCSAQVDNCVGVVDDEIHEKLVVALMPFFRTLGVNAEGDTPPHVLASQNPFTAIECESAYVATMTNQPVKEGYMVSSEDIDVVISKPDFEIKKVIVNGGLELPWPIPEDF